MSMIIIIIYATLLAGQAEVSRDKCYMICLCVFIVCDVLCSTLVLRERRVIIGDNICYVNHPCHGREVFARLALDP